jgi:hypothetical protein
MDLIDFYLFPAFFEGRSSYFNRTQSLLKDSAGPMKSFSGLSFILEKIMGFLNLFTGVSYVDIR